MQARKGSGPDGRCGVNIARSSKRPRRSIGTDANDMLDSLGEGGITCRGDLGLEELSGV